tara:strand:- start:1025 stop:2224 length:1200 start_codon:yes stop_codon:yes gene_type:complete
MNFKTEREEIETGVIGTYKKELPSVHFLEDPEQFAKRQTARENHFRFALNFPPEMFAGRTLLDIGGGTGDNTIFYNIWGADCTIVDANQLALQRAEHVFETLGNAENRVSFTHSSVFDYSSDELFDIVVSEGVCHHTADKKRCFEILASRLKRGGYCYFGIGNQSGSFQRQLQRAVLRRFAGDEAEIEQLAERLFPEHLERATTIGQRSKRAIIYDTYVNPKHDNVHVADILEWFEKAGLTLYSSYPHIYPPFVCDGPMRSSLLEIAKSPLIGVIPELFWMIHNVDDLLNLEQYLSISEEIGTEVHAIGEFLNDVAPNQHIDFETGLQLCERANSVLSGRNLLGEVFKFAEGFFAEVAEVFAGLEERNFERVEQAVSGARYLFHGPNGVAMTYFVGYKS